jgi:ABC-2 type transport system ATP-binding protein
MALASTIGLLGHNGAGKSTFLRYLAGHFPGATGHPFLPLWQDLTPYRFGGAVLVPHPPALDPRLTGREHCRLVAGVQGAHTDPEELLAPLGHPDMVDPILSTPAGEQSLGMRRRLALGLALIGPIRPLLLDEPFAGLDAFAREPLQAALARLATERPLVVASNEPTDLVPLTERVRILQNGAIAHEGTTPSDPETLRERYLAYPPHRPA